MIRASGLLLLLGAAPPWESPRLPAGAPAPAGLVGMKAADCGVCHAEIYAEWQSSIHAHAWTDRQFQGELSKDPEVGWVCLNCHTPAGDQQAEITRSTGQVRAPAREKNASFDEAWREEGISCASCHVREGVVLGPHAVGAAPHPVRQDESLRSPSLCLSCHQAMARYEDALVCSFNTGTEWVEAGIDQSCQDCHMPAVSRAAAPGAPEREGKRHLFLGSRVPKDELSAQEQAYYALFQPGADVVVTLPDAAEVGARVEGQLTLSNARAGHQLPSGDPERYLLATIEIYDASGALLGRTLYRVGQRWSWWPVANKLADNRLSPGESRSIPFSFPMPEGGAEVRMRVEHFRISPENAAYHQLDGYPISSLVSEGRWTVGAAPR